MRLRDGVTFDEAKKMIVDVWQSVRPPSVNKELLGDGDVFFKEIEQYWIKVNDHEVLDFSVCWLFCYGNSGGSYKNFEPEVPDLWKKLFVIPYDVFVYFQTAMDNGIVIESPAKRYMHKIRDKFYDDTVAFTFY